VDTQTPEINGISSTLVTLVAGAAPTSTTGETGFGSNSDDGSLDSLSDLTIDFGFATRFGVGNLVFTETDNNGKYDNNDIRAAGVIVNLHHINNGVENAVPVATTITGLSGPQQGTFLLYVPPSGSSTHQYRLRIPASQFTNPASPLYNHTVAKKGSGDDNVGQDALLNDGLVPESSQTPAATFGIRTNAYTFSLGSAGGEAGYLGTSDDNGGEDSNIDLSYDLGFKLLAGQSRPASDTESNILTFTAPGSLPASAGTWSALRLDPASDPDADGLPSLLEYALGTALEHGHHSARFRLSHENTTGSVFAHLTRPTVLPPDVRYTLQISSDQLTWQNSPAAPQTKPNADGTSTATYPISPQNTDCGYVRLQVALDADLDGNPEATATSATHAWKHLRFQTGRQTLSMPLQQPALLSGQVLTTTQNGLTVQNGSIDLQTTLQGHPAAYIEILTGALTGHTYDLDLSTSRGNALNLLQNAPAGLLGERIALRPHWTLAQLVPASQLQAAESTTLADRALFWDAATQNFQIHWLQAASSGPRWVRQGDSTLRDAGSRLLQPQEGLLLQLRGSPATLFFSGELRTHALPAPAAGSTQFRGTSSLQSQKPATLDLKTGARLRLWSGDRDPASASYQNLQLMPGAQWQDTTTGQDVSEQELLQPFRAQFITP
jgi:hypothetical protein